MDDKKLGSLNISELLKNSGAGSELEKIRKSTIDLKKIGQQSINNPFNNLDIKPLPSPDHRSRQERKDDFEKKISGIDKEWLAALKNRVKELPSDDHPYLNIKDDMEDALIKFTRYIDQFEHFNSEEERQLAYRKKELKAEAGHDWKEKSRLLFFRVLSTTLFIASLFAIGYIEHNYDWARLPMAKYLNPSKILPGK